MAKQGKSAPARGYERGETPIFSFRGDPRFGYCLYVPPAFDSRPQDFELLILVHGTSRTVMRYRDGFRDFARFTDHVLLAPLFPVGPLGDDNAHGYKVLSEEGIRYDLLLLAMVDEACGRLGRGFERFKLFGYSGGGQFGQRFSLLHSERLSAVSIGAPGSITLLDDNEPWFVGTGGCETIYGKRVNLERLREIPTQIVLGAADVDPSLIMYAPGSVQYMDGINDTGANRVERAQALFRMYRSHGIDVRLDMIGNCAHEAVKVFPAVQDFFQSVTVRN